MNRPVGGGSVTAGLSPRTEAGRDVTISDMVRSSRSGFAALLVLCLLLFAGRASATAVQANPGGGAPPVVICGQTLYDAPLGAITDDFFRAGHYELTRRLQANTAGGIPRILDFVTSCKTGVSVSFKPSRDLVIYSVARTEDHRIAAVAVIARRAGVVQVVVVRIQTISAS